MDPFRNVLLAAILLSFCGFTHAQSCPYRIPHGPVALHDLEQVGQLSFTRDIRVINLYWGGNNWDGIAEHKFVDANHYGFQKEDIDAATAALFDTDYFDRLCQYGGASGGPKPILISSTDTGQFLNPCLPHVPENDFSVPDLFELVTCEEGCGTWVSARRRVRATFDYSEVRPNVSSLNSSFGSGFGLPSAQTVDHNELCSSISSTAESLGGAKR